MLHFSIVRATFLTIKHFMVIPRCGYKNGPVRKLGQEALLQRCVKFIMLNCAREIKVCHALLKADVAGKYEKEKIKKRESKGDKVCLINENEVEVYMHLTEAEKYARRNNLTLVQLDSSTKGKKKYKFQKVSEMLHSENTKKDKSKSKTILLSKGISKADLLIKINHMIKLLKKQVEVICVIQSDDLLVTESVHTELNESELKHYFVLAVSFKKGLKLHYKPKEVHTLQVEEQPKDVKDVKVKNAE